VYYSYLIIKYIIYNLLYYSSLRLARMSLIFIVIIPRHLVYLFLYVYQWRKLGLSTACRGYHFFDNGGLFHQFVRYRLCRLILIALSRSVTLIDWRPDARCASKLWRHRTVYVIVTDAVWNIFVCPCKTLVLRPSFSYLYILRSTTANHIHLKFWNRLLVRSSNTFQVSSYFNFHL